MTKIRSLLVGLVLSLAWFLAPVLPAWAADPVVSLNSNISVNQNGQARVKHIFSLKNATDLPATVELSVLGTDIKGLTAQEEDDAKLNVALNEDKTRVGVSIPKDRQAKSGTWSFTVEYSTSPLGDLGGVKAMQIPALDSNLAVTKHNLRVAADLDLGFASVRGPAPAKTGVGIGQQLLDFVDKNSQIEDSILILFGQATYAQVTVATTLKNNSWWWRDVTLTLPPDTNQQRVMLASLEPQPSNVKLDHDGNILAVYRIGPLGQKEVTAKVDVAVSGPSYNLEEALGVDQTDPLLVERYTSLTDNWQSQGFEVKLPDNPNAAEVAEAVFDAVVVRIQEEEANIDDLLQVKDRTPPLKYADWLVGELRSRGLPARVVLGLVYTDGERIIEQPRQSAWAEIFIAGVGWVTADPWLGAHGGQFGATDPLHIGLGLWGIEDDRPPVPTDGASAVFSEDAPPEPPEPTPAVKAVKHVILPFFSVLTVSVSSGQPVIVDDVASVVNGQQYLIGSVAPAGWASQRLPALGMKAFSSENVQAGQLNGDEFTLWAETSSTTSYRPLITIVVLLLLVWFIWRRLRKRRGKRFKPSKESLKLHDDTGGGQVEDENLVAPPPVEDIQISDSDDPKPAPESEPKPPSRLVQ